MSTLQTVNQSCNTDEQQPQLLQARTQPLPQTQASAITNKTVFQTLMLFNQRCRHDDRLTPATQLIYRVLIDFDNAAFWQDTFKCPTEELIRITGLARQTIIDCKRRLKSLGYIDFSGNPSKYTIYSLVDREIDHKVDRSGGKFNTSIQQHNTTLKKRTSREERQVKPHEHLHHAELDADWIHSPELDELLS